MSRREESAIIPRLPLDDSCMSYRKIQSAENAVRARLVRPLAPQTALLLILLMSLIALPGWFALRPNTDPATLLGSRDSGWQQYQELIRHFPQQQDMLLIIVQGDLLRRDNLELLAETPGKLRQSAKTIQVLSPFALPQVRRRLARLQIGADAETLAGLRPLLGSPDQIASRFFSPTLDAMLFSVQLEPLAGDNQQHWRARQQTLGQIRQLMASHLAGSDLSFSLAGSPALAEALADGLLGSLIKSTLLAIAVAALLSLLLFRNVGIALLALAAPLLSAGWALGISALVLPSINPLTRMTATLALVLTLTGSLHLFRHYLQSRRQHPDRSAAEAVSETLAEVLPACLLAALTTLIGFTALLLTGQRLLVEFALAGGIAVICGYLALHWVTSGLQWFDRLVSRWARADNRPYRSSFGNAFHMGLKPAAAYAREFASGDYPPEYPSDHLRRRDKLALLAGLVVLLVSLPFAGRLSPAWHFADYLPDDHPLIATTRLADEKLDGLMPLSVMLHWPDEPPGLQRHLGTLKQLRSHLDSSEPVWSDLNDVLTNVPALTPAGRLRRLPESIRALVVGDDLSHALISSRLPMLEPPALQQRLARIRAQLAEFGKASNGPIVALAGLPLLIEQHIASLKLELAGSVLITILGGSLLAGWWFRSLRIAVLLVLPNLLPVLPVLAVSALFGIELTLVVVIAACVATGLAYDNSIHLLVHYRNRRHASSRLTMQQVGPTLIAATTVLVCGFSILLISNIAVLRQLGLLIVILLIAALAVDLRVMPALLRLTGK